MVGGRGGGGSGVQLPTSDAESKSAKIPKSIYGGGWGGGGGGGVLGSTFQLLMLSPSLLKSQSPYTMWGVG